MKTSKKSQTAQNERVKNKKVAKTALMTRKQFTKVVRELRPKLLEIKQLNSIVTQLSDVGVFACHLWCKFATEKQRVNYYKALYLHVDEVGKFAPVASCKYTEKQVIKYTYDVANICDVSYEVNFENVNTFLLDNGLPFVSYDKLANGVRYYSPLFKLSDINKMYKTSLKPSFIADKPKDDKISFFGAVGVYSTRNQLKAESRIYAIHEKTSVFFKTKYVVLDRYDLSCEKIINEWIFLRPSLIVKIFDKLETFKTSKNQVIKLENDKITLQAIKAKK